MDRRKRRTVRQITNTGRRENRNEGRKGNKGGKKLSERR
jgi:hypothetical protein